jgi:hypothetical protein
MKRAVRRRRRLKVTRGRQGKGRKEASDRNPLLPPFCAPNSLITPADRIVQEQARPTTLTKTTPHEHSYTNDLTYLEDIHSCSHQKRAMDGPPGRRSRGSANEGKTSLDVAVRSRTSSKRKRKPIPARGSNRERSNLGLFSLSKPQNFVIISPSLAAQGFCPPADDEARKPRAAKATCRL